MSNQKRLPYDKRLRPVARKLRRQMTKSERRLWAKLRRKQMRGYTFNRQFIIQRYIVDFFCRRLNLVVEVDGLSHDAPGAAAYDAARQRDLEALGLTVLRFDTADVFNALDDVLLVIDGWIDDATHDKNRE